MNKIYTIALLLAIGIITSQCACPIPLNSQVKIHTDSIQVQAPSKTPIQNPIAPVQYVYNHQQTFSSTPQTAFGIGGFEFRPSSDGSIAVGVTKLAQSSTKFKIAVIYNSNWQSVKFSFVSTNRPDIEIGQASIKGPVSGDTFTINYPFKNKWTQSRFLRFKVFISGFSLRTNQQSVLRASLEKADLSTTGIQLLYSTKESTTIIEVFSVSFIIFDGYNPAFRFSEGVISQSYISTKVSVSVPKQGVSESRYEIVGLTSFEVNFANFAVTITTNFNSDFSLELGPTQNNCKINLLSLSYLILSVYQECGACYPNSIYLNNKCVDRCPIGFYIQNGKCQQKKCQKGFYLIMNQCKKCPKYSDIKQCNNSCPIGTKLIGENCFSICTQQNQVFSYGTCICSNNFYRINGKCAKCQKGTKYDYISKTCVSFCPANSFFVNETQTCKCNDGYNLLHGRCHKCAANQVFDNTWGCHISCPQNYVFNGKDCVCAFGFYQLSSGCGKCKEDEVYDHTKKACIPRCSNYEIWQANTCNCVSDYYRINGVCQKCSDGQIYDSNLRACRNNCINGQIWVAGKCQCNPGSYFINNNCQICPVQRAYDPTTKQCQKICKKQYQYFNNGICQCQRSYERGPSGDCVPKKCPENSFYNSFYDTCVCNQDYILSAKTGQCEKIPTCPANSKYIYGCCICNSGWFMNADKSACLRCDPNLDQVYNGQKCVCKDGYTLSSDGKCKIIVVPVCKDNQYFEKQSKNCFCSPGFERINGVCCKRPTCQENQSWNGKSCVCVVGYVQNSTTKKCQKVVEPKPIPQCPYNSYFNGIKCVCNPRFFEFQPGVCATCPPLMNWNGKKCAYSKECWAGYKWDNLIQCCVPIGPACQQNSKWNGQACQCQKGYNSVGNTCIKCQNGYQFDGSKCSRVPKPLLCIELNTIPVDGKCVCRDGTNLYNGNCIQCIYPTVWNGNYCQGNVDACLSVPNSQVDIVTRRCRCKIGYRGISGTCVPIPGYLYQNGYIYTWSSGYRWAGGLQDTTISEDSYGNNRNHDNYNDWDNNNNNWNDNNNWNTHNNNYNNNNIDWQYIPDNNHKPKQQLIILPPFLPKQPQSSTRFVVYNKSG